MATSETKTPAAPAAPVATPVAKNGSVFAASINIGGSNPIKSILVVSGVGIASFATYKLVNKFVREKKIEVTEK